MEQVRVMNRWLVVVGAVLIQLCLGAIYAWSVFTPALIEAGWSRLQTQIVFSVGLVTFALVMVWAGRRLPEWGPRRMTWLSGVVLGTGYILGGLFDGTNFLGVTLFVGIVGGGGIGLGYVVPIAVGMRWFPDKKGLITGLAVAGFGFGAMLWIKLAGTWGDLLGRFGLSATFIIYGFCFAALVFLGGVWMVYPPEGWRPKGYKPPQRPVGGRVEADLGREYSLGEMLESSQFYLIFLTFAVSAGAGLMSIGLMKLYPMEALTGQGVSVQEASAMAGVAMAVFFSIANGLGRIAWGSISDKLGRKRSIMIMTASQGFFVMAFTVMAGYGPSLYIGAALIGFNFGGNFALFPTMTADTFGTKRVGQNYPYVFLAYGVGGIAGPILGGMLGDMQNFPLAFTITGMACIAGAGLISMVTPLTRRPEARVQYFPPSEPVVRGEVPVPTEFRGLQSEDLEAISSFPVSSEELFYMFPEAEWPLSPEQIKALAAQRKDPTVLVYGGLVAGYGNFMDCRPQESCSVGNIVVGPGFRRLGIGTALLEHMAEKARQEYGAAKLRAACFNADAAGLLFFQKKGFKPVDMEVQQDPNGREVVLFKLEKELAADR